MNCTDYETSEDEELIEACELLDEYDLLEEEITEEDIEAAVEEFKEEEVKGGVHSSSEEEDDEESGGRGDRGDKSGHSEGGGQREREDRVDFVEEARTATESTNERDANYESNNSASISIGFVQTAIPYNNFYGIRAKLLKSDENTLAAYGGAVTTPSHPEVSMFGKFAIEFNRPINYPIRVVKEYMKDYREVIPKVEPSKEEQEAIREEYDAYVETITEANEAVLAA